MKRIIYKILIFSISVLTLFTLVSCADDDKPKKKLTLYVYNWGEYISDGSEDSYDTNAAFSEYYEKKYGVAVDIIYSTYASNEDMYSKIKSEAGSYDVIFPSDYMAQQMIEEGLLLDFEATSLENFKNLSDEYTGLYYDPENDYTAAYSYGKVGVIYNTTMVDPEDVEKKSWDLLWNEKYSGKILQFNNSRDAFATAMYKLGIDVNSKNKSDWDRTLDELRAQKPLVQSYVSDEIFNKMISNSASIATYYAGDYITMLDSNPDLGFYYPVEGTNVFVDVMCIPKNAKNPELAKEYINFMLSPEPAIANALYIGYASPNKAVYEDNGYIKEMGEDAIDILYADYTTAYRFDPYFHSFPKDVMFTDDMTMKQYVNSLWEELKTENSTELWVHITSIVIVGALAGYGGYSIYIKKKRSRDYRLRDKEKRLAKRQAAK